MNSELNTATGLNSGAGLSASATLHEAIHINHHYDVRCYDVNGNELWHEEFDNLVTTVGKNKYLDATLKTGLASPAWYVGLKDTGSVVAGDTMASHAGWTEDVNYSQATRPAWTPGSISAGSVDNSGSVATFTMNASTTIYGAFLVDNNTKSGTTGTLLGGGDFGTAQPAISGNTITVTVTCSLT